MSEARRYHFATPAQWSAGLLGGASPDTRAGLSPAAAWSAGTKWLACAGAAVAFGPEGIAFWNDGFRTLWQAEAGPESDEPDPISRRVSAELARATHLAAGRVQLWACDSRPELRAHVRDGLVLRFQVALDVERVIDVAADGNDGVWVLASVGDTALALHVDCSGDVGERVPMPARCGPPLGLAWTSGRLVLLDAGGTSLTWIDLLRPNTAMHVSIGVARPGGVASAIAGDMHRIVIAGVDEPPFGSAAWVVTCDAKGGLLGSFELDEAPVDLACCGSALVVTTRNAIWRFGIDPAATPRRSEAAASFVTPALESWPIDGRTPWQRAEAQAMLPEGTVLEFSVAGTDDASTLDRARAVFSDPSLAPAVRRQRLNVLLEWSAPLRFEHIVGTTADATTTCVLPLHQLRSRWLWVAVNVIAAPGSATPRIDSLDVLHPDESLMQYLPAIYRRQGEETDDFLRTLVAALDASVGSLDKRIATLGKLLDPRDAPEAWLDAEARWLGIPWDDTLELDIKRALLVSAPKLLEQRGTRAGLQVLLDALLPCGRTSIVDVGVDHGFVMLAAPGLKGSCLPALLSGWPSDAMVLNAKACVGRGRLSGASFKPDSAAWLAGRIDIRITATPQEQQTWSAWLRPLLDAMTPLTATLRVQWQATTAQPSIRTLDDDLTLEADPRMKLGASATLGRSRLDSLRGTTLDRAGAAPGFTLQ
jgi:phage tail-like protein